MPFTGPWKSLALGQHDCQPGLLGSTECMGSVTWLCFCVSFFPCPWLPSSMPHEACRTFLNGGHGNSPVINKKRSLRTVGFKHTHTMDPTHMHAAQMHADLFPQEPVSPSQRKGLWRPISVSSFLVAGLLIAVNKGGRANVDSGCRTSAAHCCTWSADGAS